MNYDLNDVFLGYERYERPISQSGEYMVDNLENRLVNLILKGDQRAFAELVELYKDKLFHLAYRMLNNRHEAEDIVQETF